MAFNLFALGPVFFVLILAAAFGGMSYIVSKKDITAAPFIFIIPPEIGTILIYLGVAAIFISIVFMIFKYRNVSAPTDEKIYYEHFESPNDWSVSALQTRINRIRAIKEEILTYGEEVGTLADETCMIMKKVEDSYINNSSQLRNPKDYNKPEAERNKMIESRQRLAKKQFADSTALYSAVNGRKPLLECFYANNEDVALAESELNTEIEQLEKILDTVEVKAAALKKEKAGMTLGFTLRYLQNAIQSLTKNQEEEFYVELRGPALIARADELIGKAAAMKDDLKELNNLLEKQNQMVDSMQENMEHEQRGGNSDDRVMQMDQLSAKYDAF
jgi:hypothetical protein